MKQQKLHTVSIYKKLNNESLQGLLLLRRRGFVVPNKKGKGSYNRKKLKGKFYNET